MSQMIQCHMKQLVKQNVDILKAQIYWKPQALWVLLANII